MYVLTEQSHHFVVHILTPIVQTRKPRVREVDEGHGLFKQRKACWLLSSEYFFCTSCSVGMWIFCVIPGELREKFPILLPSFYFRKV